ncbi:MAG TPA: NAD(P)H-dependent oxidoreductase subunit E [Longimicrobiales bacterium]|nr:NAD(P)H-dependent oxidoreductase subunit E [Longimicrobiales bacterium]
MSQEPVPGRPRSRRKSGGVRLRPSPKGRAVDERALADVRTLLGDEPRRPDLLIEHLHRIQDAHGCLTAAHLTALAHELALAPAEVYEVATFYHHFDIVKDGDAPPPELTVRVCESVACHMNGADEMLAALRQRLGDGIRVIAAPCVGRCDSAPVAVVGRRPVDHATVDVVAEAAQAARTDAARTEPELPSYTAYGAYRDAGGYRALAACVGGERDADDVMAAVDAAGLRGLGGAGFPTAQKWRFVRQEPGPRVVAINADEGEPGTFKDRYCLETDPHRVLEGMLIAAWVVGADDVFFYLRDEYAACRAILTREIAALQADPTCALPRVHIRRCAGAYICGEETALIESIEGKRGEPRLRPPFPAQAGVFGRPTLVQNVESVYWLRSILDDGAGTFADQDRAGHRGVRLYSVSGRVARPGVYRAANGITVRELIGLAGGMSAGHEFYGYLPGGASGGILPASLGDVPLDFRSLDEYGCFIGSAAVVVLSRHDRARDIAHNLMHFFAHESCGKCTPCRVGTAKAEKLMRNTDWNLPVLQDLADVMNDASICGLGQAAPNPLRSIERFFAHELHELAPTTEAS